MARNPFYVQPASPDITPLAMGVQSFIQQRGAKKGQEEAQAAMLAAVQSGDPSKVAEFATQYPEYQQAAKTAFGFTNEATEQIARETYRRVLSDPENAGQHLAEGIVQVNEAGGMPRMMSGDLQMFQQNPEAALRNMQVGFASIDPKGWDAMQEEKKDKTTELPADQRAFENLIKDFTPEEQEQARRIKARIAPGAVGSAVQTIAGTGNAELIGDTKAIIRQREKFGEMTGASRAKAIDKGIENIQKIDLGIRNLDEAMAALDGGASTGALQSFAPSIRASSVALDNVRNRLALDVLNAATFGALSEKELEIVKETALPTKLKPAELRKWLELRKSGEQKLRNYYQEQIDHLDQGGTVASFLRMKRREQEGSREQETVVTPEGAQQTEAVETPEGVAVQQTTIQEGATATNPTTGQRVIFTNGQWQPAP